MDHHYNPHILQRLRQLIDQDETDEKLIGYLSSLSNAAFRTAGYCLGEHLAMELPRERCWQLVCHLVAYDARAFLVNLARAVGQRLRRGQLALSDPGFATFAQLVGANPEDVRKTLRELLPAVGHPSDGALLFRALGLADPSLWLPHLLTCPTLPCYYLLFRSLRHLDHRQDLIRRTVRFLVGQGDALSFNLASLLCAYFGIERPPGTFSLRLAPYELSRIEQSYDAFVETMQF